MKTPSVPTGSFKDLVQNRMEHDPAFKAELMREGRGEPTGLAKAIFETADGMRQVGIMNAETHSEITARHPGCLAVT